MLGFRYLISQFLFLAIVLGLQACGLEAPDFNSIGSGQNEQSSGNDNQGNNDGSSNGGSDASVADLVSGKQQYEKFCVSCHGATGQGGVGGEILQCNSCGNMAEFAHYVETKMPIKIYEPSACGKSCSQQIASYVFAGFPTDIGNNDNGGSTPDNGNGGTNNTAGVFFSETFENTAVDSLPAGWDSLVGYRLNQDNSKSTGKYALVDETQAFRGKRAIHFKGDMAQMLRPLPEGTDHFHMRAFVRLNKQLGAEPGDNHEHIMGIKATRDANNEVRVGQVKGQLGTNAVPSDDYAGSDATHKLQSGQWYCVETAFYGDAAYDQLYMWVDGELVHSIQDGSEWKNRSLADKKDWLSGRFNYAMFGFHSFSGNMAEVWMDDIVMSTEAIGCNPIQVNDPSNGGDDNGNGGSDNGGGSNSEQVASGKALYGDKCASCHGADGQSKDFPEIETIDASQSTFGGRTLAAYIAAEMSDYAKGCTGDCAADVAAYIKSWVDSGSDSGNDDSSNDDSGNGGSGDDDVDYGSCGAINYGPRSIRVLTAKEFANSIEDLTGINVVQDLGQSSYDAIPADNILDGFSNNMMANIDTGGLQSYDLVVNKIVAKLAENDFQNVFDCSAYDDNDSCAAGFISTYMPKVFRRPLTDDEASIYKNMFNADYTGGVINEGFSLALKTMFTSPQFLYRDETGISVEDTQGDGIGSSVEAVKVLIDSPKTLSNYQYEGFHNLNLGDDDVVVLVARSVDTPSEDVSIQAGDLNTVLTVEGSEFKTYKIPFPGQGGESVSVSVQPHAETIEVSSLKVAPASALKELPKVDVKLDDDAYVLTPYQLASYLAFTFTGSTPDDALLEAAAKGKLDTKEQISAQVERLLKTDRAHKHFGDFAAQWLRTDGVLTTTKSETLYPGFTQEVRKAMAQEVRDIFTHVVLDGGEPFSSMYDGDFTFANQALAEFYGIAGVTGSQMRKVTGVTDRAGLVTSGAFMAVHAHEEDTGPILRSTYFRRRMLCQHVPIPPTGVSLTSDGTVDFDVEREAALQKLKDYLAAHGGKATSRLKYETQTSASVCQTCHKEMINPLGFGFEDFDSVGLPQNKDFNGLTIDASGTLYGVNAVGDSEVIQFNGAKELASQIADLDVTRQCFVENSFRMAMGTGSTYIDRVINIELSDRELWDYSCQVEKLDTIMKNSGNDPVELLKALGTMDSVRYRKNVSR
jgi:mono/diheme cytochrome c family protein